jgi:hypothetical protein
LTTVIAQKIRCREISEADLDAVAELLTRGFAGRSRDYWMQGLQRQAIREVPEGYPRFGYMLHNDGCPVGVLLLLYTSRRNGSVTTIQCNLSSWYVEPAFRNYAPLLTKIAQRHKEVTYLNISPATWTWPIIEAQGFVSYCSGLFFSIPALSGVTNGMTVETVAPEAQAIDGLPDAEVELLTRHARYGCLSLVCRDITEYVACAGTIGRMLIRYGKLSVILDSNGSVPGVAGIYSSARGRKYFKGPHSPRLADLTDTELVLYGP